MKLYQLAPQILDWLQHTAMPWVQAKFGLSDSFWKFDKIKAAITEHMGQATDIVGIVLSKATAYPVAFGFYRFAVLLLPGPPGKVARKVP